MFSPPLVHLAFFGTVRKGNMEVGQNTAKIKVGVAMVCSQYISLLAVSFTFSQCHFLFFSTAIL